MYPPKKGQFGGAHCEVLGVSDIGGSSDVACQWQYCSILLCRVKVLWVDVVSSKLLLTHKKSLVNSKMAAVTSYNDLQPGVIVEGCIVSITSSGLVIAFYSRVKVSIYLWHKCCSHCRFQSHDCVIVCFVE